MIFETLTKGMKEYDSNVDKCIPFGSNSATRMIGKRILMVVCFNDQVNPFLTSIHCTTLDATNAPNCNEFSKNIDTSSMLLLDIEKSKLHYEDFNQNLTTQRKVYKWY